MLIIKDIYNLHTYLKAYRDKGYSIGYVPTMGALHEGHGSLIEKSRNDNQKPSYLFLLMKSNLMMLKILKHIQETKEMIIIFVRNTMSI